MVSTPEWCTDNNLMTPNQYVSTKSPIARKSLRQFSETVDVKHNNAVCRLAVYKAKREAIKKIKVFWWNIAKRHFHKKIYQKVRESLYNFILHPQFVPSPILNYFIFVSFDGNSGKQLTPKLLFEISVQELYNRLVSPPE